MRTGLSRKSLLLPGPRSEHIMIKKFTIFALLALILLPAGVMATGSQGMGSTYGSSDERIVTPSVGSIQITPLTDDGHLLADLYA